MKSALADGKKLNPEQKKAVEHGKGPLLIIAGAGTGKTTVVTERIKYLIVSGLAAPTEILALTFTEKASREMEDRVDKALPYGITQMWISTFHSFCDRVLRNDAINIGLDPGYKLMSDAETIHYFRSHLFEFDLDYFRPLGNPNKFIEAMLTHFERLRDEDISPSQYKDWISNVSQKSKVKSQNDTFDKLSASKSKVKNNLILDSNLTNEELSKYQELASAYRKYEELKVKDSVADYADLISNTLKLMRLRRDVLTRYQNQFKYILVDEFQDTNYAQNELVKLLAGESQNLTVVADDDQSIYKWRGASISNILQFKKNFPKAEIITLTRNYRSTQEILDRSYNLIQFNNPDRLEIAEKIDKKLESMRRINGSQVELILTDRVENEAETVAKKIMEIISSSRNSDQSAGTRPYSYRDFAILVRANNHSHPFAQALGRHGIPYQFLGPGQLFRQSEVKDLIAYLKVLYNLRDSVALYRVLTMEWLSLGARDLSIIVSFAKSQGFSVFEVAEKLAQIDIKTIGGDTKLSAPLVSRDAVPKITNLINMIHRHLELVKKESAGQILYYFLSDTGLLTRLATYKTESDERTALNISKFFDKIKNYEANHDDASVYAVVDWLDLSMDLGESPLASDTDWTENDAVNILTIHSAKGLEFPVVFLVNLVNARFPSTDRKDVIPIPEALIKEILPTGDFHLQEERRLFYVGLTRARDRVFLTGAKFYADAKREKKWSPFIYETMGADFVDQNSLSTTTAKQLSFLDFAPPKENNAPQKTGIQVSYLSYSQIESFQTCPLQYRYKNILKLPVTPKAALTFGDTIHRTLQDFYALVMDKQKPDFKKLLEIFDSKWISVGYGNKIYEEKMKQQGYDILKGFYQKGYNPKLVPVSLEQVFKIKIDPGLSVGGKIDRVDRLSDGTLEIIDYKTGQPSKNKNPKTDLQLTVYALAATDPGLFKADPEKVIVSFYYFDTQEKVPATRTREQLLEAREKIAGIAEDIRHSKFLPTPGKHCDFCEFRLVCEAWQ